MKRYRDVTIYVFILLFLITLLLFSYFSDTIAFHDVFEYITTAKELAGIHNLNIFTTHSLVYPYFLSFFLKILPGFTMIKIINSLFLFINGLLLYYHTKNKKTLLLWAFSPFLWFMSIQIIPMVPASTLILLSYILFKKYEDNGSKLYLFISGLSLGLAGAVYSPAFIVALFFILVFFWKRISWEVFLYLIFFAFGVLPRLILDYFLFRMPIYSLVRYFGANLLVILGNSPFKLEAFYSYWLLIPIIFTPLLFMIYKVDFKKYNKEIIFLILCTLFFGIRGGDSTYFILFIPIVFIPLSENVDRRLLQAGILISVILVIIFTSSYFGNTQDVQVTKDLNKIFKEYPSDYYIAGENRAAALATFSWKDKPKFYWLWEYEFEKDNTKVFSSYDITSKPRINSDKILILNFRLEKANKINFRENSYLINYKIDPEPPANFVKIKEYGILRIYRSVI